MPEGHRPEIVDDASISTPHRCRRGGESFRGRRMTTTEHERGTPTPVEARPDREGGRHRRVERYGAAEIEPRWQARWGQTPAHQTHLHDQKRPKVYPPA